MFHINFNTITQDIVAKLVSIHKESFENHWSEKDFINLLSNSFVHGILSPQGFILYTLIECEAEILTICIKEQDRKKGYASQLINCLLNTHPELTKIFLEVNQTNEAAQALYKKFGFEQIGIRKNYYNTSKGPQNALTFVLKL